MGSIGEDYADIGEVYGFGTQQAFWVIKVSDQSVSYTDNNESYVSNAQYNSLNHDYLVADRFSSEVHL